MKHLCLCVAVLLLATACNTRRPVDEGEARAVLTQAVTLAANEQFEELCALSDLRGSAGTCAQSVEDIGVFVPDQLPEILCSLPLPAFGPLRKGHLLVLQGTDNVGDPYRTEFPVWHDGSGVRVLDAVYWSGLSIQSYADDTLTWRFDSASDVCTERALPGADGQPVPLDATGSPPPGGNPATPTSAPTEAPAATAPTPAPAATTPGAAPPTTAPTAPAGG